jgi:amino acid transporter
MPSTNSANAPSGTAAPTQQLRQNAIGTFGIVFFVLAFAAPLAAIMGVGPLVLGSAGSSGAPAAFALTTVILLVFSVGFAAMSREHSGPGGFAVYIGLAGGEAAARAASFVAVLGYNCFLFGNAALLGVTASSVVNGKLGIDLPWWVYVGLALVGLAVLGYREVSLSVKVLGVLLVLEMVIILVLDAVVLVKGGASGINADGFAPHAMGQGAIGTVFLLAFACFVGFEATTLFGEEARDRHRTIPRATYIAVLLVGGFYTLVIWVFQLGWGKDVVERADGDPGNFIFNLNTHFVGAWSTDVMQWLVITSIFAAVMSMHGALSRYLFAMGRDGILPAKVGTSHPTMKSPHVASLVQSAVTVVGYVVIVAVGADPLSVVYAWFVGVGAVAIVLLYLTASVAVCVSLRRSTIETRVAVTTLAPLAAAAAMAIVLYLAIHNFGFLTGSTNALINGLWLLAPLAALLGYFAGRRRRGVRVDDWAVTE